MGNPGIRSNRFHPIMVSAKSSSSQSESRLSGSFGFPDPIIATIVSFTTHPGGSQFHELRNLSSSVKRAVDKFPQSFAREPLLVVANSPYSDDPNDTNLDGEWYLTNKGASSIGKPEIPGIPEGYFDFSQLGERTIYQFGRCDAKDGESLYIFTKTIDLACLVPQPAGVSIPRIPIHFFELSTHPLEASSRTLTQQESAGIIGMFQCELPRRCGSWYGITPPKGGGPSRLVGPNPAEHAPQHLAELKVELIRKILKDSSRTNPTLTASPISRFFANPEPEMTQVRDPRWDRLRIAVFWPGREGDEL